MIRRIAVSPPRLTGDDAELEATEEHSSTRLSDDASSERRPLTLHDDDEQTLVLDSAPPPPMSEAPQVREPLVTDAGDEKLGALVSAYEQRVERLAREADEAAAAAANERLAADARKERSAGDARFALPARVQRIVESMLRFIRALSIHPRSARPIALTTRIATAAGVKAVRAQRALTKLLPKDELLARGWLFAIWGIACSALTLLLTR